MINFFNYSGLDAILKSKGLTKSDLRQRCGFSTSTLAKFSAGQSVSMEVLADIAAELDCELGDIVQLRPNHSPMPWVGLRRTRTFCIRILCLTHNGNADYVYGYATPFSMTDEGITQWKVMPIAGQSEAVVLEGYADAALLRNFIASVEQGETIGQFANKIDVSIKATNGKSCLVEMIRNVAVCGGRSVYRPPFLLLSWQACKRLRQEMLPELSPTDGTMICESLIGLNKQALYTTDGTPDTSKMMQLLNILQSEFTTCRSASDAKHLGNFEVLTYPSETYDGKAGITIQVEKSSEADGTVQRILLSFCESALRGDFIVELITYTYTDPVSDTIRQVHCDGSPLEIIYYTKQLVSRVEVKLWENSAVSTRRGELIAHWAYDLIMGCAIDISVVEQRFSFADHWSNMLTHIGEELTPSRVSRLGSPTDKLIEANPWDAVNNALACDFTPILPDPRLPDTDRFFPAGEGNQVEYLKWLKDTLRKNPAKRVIIIDPYVKLNTITALLRCLEDVKPAWEIYMDRSRKNGKKHVEEIRQFQEELNLTAPPNFSIWSVDGKLHDRYMILLSTDTVTVYMFSNSFDTVAENYSSAVIRVGNQLARIIYTHYLELFTEERNRSALEEVYFSPRNRKQQRVGSRKREPDITAALPDGIDPKDEVETVGEARNIISQFLHGGTVKMAQHFKHECHNIKIFLIQSRPLDHGLLSDADYMIKQEIVTDHHFTWRLPILDRAVNTLLQSDLNAFLETIEQFTVVPISDSFALRQGFLGVVMLYELLESGMDIFQDSKVREIFFASKLAPIRAIAAIQCICAAQRYPRWSGISVTTAADWLREGLSPKEALCAFVFFIRELRVNPKLFSDEESELIDPMVLYPYVVQAARDCLAQDSSAATVQTALSPLYPNYSHDIGCLLLELRKTGVLNKDTARELFCEFILKRYQDSSSPEQDFLRVVDLKRTCELLDMACRIDSGVVKQIQKGLKKMEISLSSQLYMPFLKMHNYDVWKHSIDLFCCLIYLELYIVKEHNGYCNKVAVDEYQKICENFETDLRRYSEVYNAVELLSAGQT